MFKKDELEEFLFLYTIGESVPYHHHEDEMSNNISVLEDPFEGFYIRIRGRCSFLKDEISENVLTLPKHEKLFYLNYLLDKLDYNSKRYDTSKLIRLLKELGIKTESLDINLNLELKNLLFTNYKSDLGTKIIEELIKIHNEYYYYFLDLKVFEIFDYIKNCIDMIENDTDTSDKLKWIGKSSQLGFIIGKLAELGYIEAPTHKSGDINYTHFAKLVKNTFECKTTEASLSKYLNLESDKGQETVRKFEDNKFNIPHLKVVS